METSLTNAQATVLRFFSTVVCVLREGSRNIKKKGQFADIENKRNQGILCKFAHKQD